VVCNYHNQKILFFTSYGGDKEATGFAQDDNNYLRLNQCVKYVCMYVCVRSYAFSYVHHVNGLNNGLYIGLFVIGNKEYKYKGCCCCCTALAKLNSSWMLDFYVM